MTSICQYKNVLLLLCTSITIFILLGWEMYSLREQYQQQFQYKSDNKNFAGMAYFISVSKGETKKAFQLLEKISAPQNCYILHLDLKIDTKHVENIIENVKALNVTNQNIFLLNRYYSSYTGVAYLDLDLTAMAYALSISMHWSHYMILSPSDYPLLTQQQISLFLAQFPENLSLVEAQIMNCHLYDQRLKVLQFDNALAGFPAKWLSSTGFEIQIPKNIKKIVKGAQWRLFSRDMVKYFIYSEDGWARRMLLLFANSMIPMEHYYQTTICNSPLVNNSVRFATTIYRNWEGTRGAMSPNKMNAVYLEQALNLGTLFARKFGTDNESEALKNVLDRMHEGEEVLINQKNYSLESVFDNAIKYYSKAIYEGSTCQDIMSNDQEKICMGN